MGKANDLTMPSRKEMLRWYNDCWFGCVILPCFVFSFDCEIQFDNMLNFTAVNIGDEVLTQFVLFLLLLLLLVVVLLGYLSWPHPCIGRLQHVLRWVFVCIIASSEQRHDAP